MTEQFKPNRKFRKNANMLTELPRLEMFRGGGKWRRTFMKKNDDRKEFLYLQAFYIQIKEALKEFEKKLEEIKGKKDD